MLTRWMRMGAAGALALGGFLVVDPFGMSSGAQSVPPTTIPFPGVDTSPDVSDDGSIVVFASLDENSETSVIVHDRRAEVTTAIEASTGGTEPTVSGDGCTVVWTVAATADDDTEGDAAPPDTAAETTEPPVTNADPSETVDTTAPDDVPVDTGPNSTEPRGFQVARATAGLYAVDRCDTGDPTPVELEPDGDVAELGPAAVSSDGGVIVVSTGSELLRFDRVETGYLQTGVTRPPVEPDPVLIDRAVDLSDDGSVAVFAAGPDLSDPTGLTVYRVERPDPTVPDAEVVSVVGEPGAHPTVSGDGSIVAYTAVVADPPASSVTVRSGDDPPVPIAEGFRPALSADGNHVVYETNDAMQVTSWIGQGLDAFAATETRTLPVSNVPTWSGPAIDRFGATVLTDAGPGGAEDDISIFAETATAGFDAETYDLGTGDVGAQLSATLSFTNDGPASVGVDSLAVDGTFTVAADGCSPTVRPRSTCTIDVAFTVEFLEEAFGTVTLTPVAALVDPVPFTAEVKAIGTAPPPSTTPTTGGSTTGGSTTGGSTTGRTTTGRTTTGRTTTGRTSTTGSRTTTTTTTTVPGAGLAFSPATFDFAPTIVDAGRRTGLLEFVNSSNEAVTVVGVRLEPADVAAFEIVETDCAGESVAAAGRCGVTVAFAPTVTDAQSVALIASTDSGVEISATVNGVGAPPPTLTVLPGVATSGQVVTLTGAGFPTGLTVELTWADSTRDVVVDDTGTFRIPVIVMPNTRSGPATASVAGQQDQFAEVSATMLVTTTSSRTQPGVLDGIGPNVGR